MPQAMLLALALAAVVAAAFWPVLHAQAIALDDPSLVVRNPLVYTPGWESVRRFFTEVLRPSAMAAYYMPLSMTSLMLDAAAGGSPANLFAFHVTNLLLHIAGTVLLFLLLRRLTGHALASALAALLYGVHPVMVEAVASAGERKTVLATALAFASTWAYVRAAQLDSRAARAAALALFALALLAKPSVLALPAVFVVLDAWPLRRGWRTHLAEKLPFVLLAGVSAAISVASVKATWEFGEPPPFDAVAIASKCAWLPAFYLKQLAWPVQLSTVYAPPAPFTLANPAVLAGVLVTVALAALAYLTRRRTPALATALTVFALLLAPTLSIVRFSPVIAYDRYLHLPAFGLALGVAFALVAALGRARLPVLGGMLVLAAIELAGTRAALAPWRDSVAIWERAVQVSPGSPVAHNGLGATWSGRGDAMRAIASFERAVQADPAYSDARQNLGRELTRQGRASEGVPHLEIAARLAPGSPAVALQLGLALQAMGDWPASERQLRRALALDPMYSLAFSPLGLARVQQGDAVQGVDYLRRGAQVSTDPGARVVLAGVLLQQAGPSDEVVQLLADALQRDRDFVPALNELAWLRATSVAPYRDTTQAIALSARAVQLTGGADASVLDTRAAAEAAAGRFAAAVASAERALQLARSAHDSTLASDVAGRLARYRQGQPYVAPTPAQH